MKTLILSIAFCGLSFLNAQTLNEKGLYIDSEGGLFSGVVSQVQNSIKSEFTVKDGLVEGDASYFYASGRLMESGYFSKGQKDHKWTRYNENGAVMAIAFYNAGKKTGTWLVFDEKGNKRFEMNYSDGQKTGIWTNWDEKGEVLSQIDHSRLN